MKWNEYPIHKISFGDKNYPILLLDLPDPPKQIYYRGTVNETLFKSAIAVVGSRSITSYGKFVIDRMVGVFVENKLTIISGFMYGVDTIAHTKALECGGLTVAVLGSGLNVCYPLENEVLYAAIIEKGGAVISEYEPNTKPQLWTFPKRNRIVAALCGRGIFIVEAAERSGSLITAKWGKRLGRKVYAIPGNINSKMSMGCNLLIKSGDAQMVLGSEDFGLLENKKYPEIVMSSMTTLESKIYRTIEHDAMTIDEIVVAINKSVSEVSEGTSTLALKGVIVEIGGKYHVSLFNS